jgi:plastocyanin/uncharacterized membrane protein
VRRIASNDEEATTSGSLPQYGGPGIPDLKAPLPQVRRFLIASVAVGVGFLLAVCVRAQDAQPASTNHVVILKQVHFDPPEITIRVGDTVEWRNEDIFSHTVTADDGSFDSGLIDPGQSFQKAFRNSQTVAYHCRPHPNMKAALIVQATSEHGPKAAAGRTETLKWLPPRTPKEFQPILVKFTSALLPLAVLRDILGRIFRRQSFHHAAWWMALYAAVITPFTAAAGWWWKLTEGSGLPTRLITVHQWLGTTAVAFFVILAIWRWRIHKRGTTPTLPYLAYALIVVLTLVYQGTLGGRMVFGK